KIKFGPKGDYEGLALLSENMYVLESSGILFKVKDWQSSASAVASRLHLPAKDNESLCYDSIGKQLLISPKSRWQKKKGGHKSKHPVFAVDPATDTMIPRPTFTIDPRDVVAFAMAHGLSLSGASEGKPHKKERLQLMLSAIAVHPLTGDIYAVSAHNRLLLSFDRTGRVTGLVQLNPALFMQPEGLAFLPDGTLIIVNESPRKKPGLLLFGWHRPKQ
ncbi:MAG: SdiA-regulated domain-containing protein, partial [Deltaproteobacteria bacterium]|nr:SdiA-regulated domain-containing protein [Deltaproteobacteria bacterium]